ncbi:MAG: Gfo/Idh/MocA family oxidoreductase [Sphingobacteriales bacterium]|nr:Gfo/Idh/MocA family oxidoreductase [Sphingobacteriales bacterium]
MASSRWSRRNILKAFGITVGGTFFPFSLWGKNETGEHLILPDNPLHRPLAKPVTAITLGAGARGNVYGDYAVEYPDQLDIVGVAEPIAIRNERYAKKHAIPDANRFQTWEDVFKKPKFADAVIISTPDQLHYGPCMAALKMGYNVLLEKPISPSEKECRDILELTKKTGKVVAVCHVLRYAPYFIKLRELMQSGAIGEIISLQHMEPIEHTHMAHSYVRGNWHNSATTTPILLAKSCHDLDIIKWMLGKESQSIQAFGDLRWFHKENAPAGSTARCTDGCAVESTCPYSALKIYYRKRQRTYVFDLPEDKDKQGDAILDFLKTTDYGRCVYRMDNDQCDHYTTNILFKDNITASFNMEAFTPWGGRRTRVMGSMGFIEGDMSKFTIYDFRTDQSKTYESKVLDVANYKNEGHGGGDWRLVADWIQAVAQQNPNLLTSTIDASIESHIMCFMAEESRANKKVMDIRM